MSSRSMTSDFTRGNITKQLFIFASPLLLSSLLQVLYNIADMAVVGHFVGKNGLSGVSVGSDVINLLMFIVMGFSNAGQIVISQHVGAKKKERLGSLIGTLISFLMISAIILSAICLLFREDLLSLMNTPSEAHKDALAYSTICITGLIFIYGYNAVSAILRGLGDSRHPLIFVAIAAGINIVLDLIFVALLGFGSGGAALATVISQGVSFVLCTIFMCKRSAELGIKLSRADFIKFDIPMFVELIKLGVPMAIKSASIQISKLFVSSYINSYGVEISAFAGITHKINSISNLISNSLNTAGSSMVGQNIGAAEYKRVPKIIRSIFVSTLAIAACMSLAVIFFPNQVFGIFSHETDVLKIADDYIPIAILIFFGSACRAPMNALINGSGNSGLNFVTAILDGIVMRLGLSVLFGLCLDMKHIGFWLGDAIAGFTPFVIGIFYFISGKWKRNIFKKE